MPGFYPVPAERGVGCPQAWHPCPVLSRRGFLLGTGGVGVAGAGAVGVGVHQGVLPGRPYLQERLGLNGEDGVVPDIEPGPIETGSFTSEHRLGAETGWVLIRPPDVTGRLPLVVALHGASGSAERLAGPDYGLPEYVAAATADGVPPFAVVTVDGGATYWQERPSGENAGAMVVEELWPLMAERGVAPDRFGLLGWSMGGYGVLHLGGLLGRSRVSAVCAVSPAVTHEHLSVVGRQDELTGIPVRVDCGTGDPFYRPTEDYVEGFPNDADVTSSFEPGGHDAGYRRRMLPRELEFLGAKVSSGA
jgi:hypothetical protein